MAPVIANFCMKASQMFNQPNFFKIYLAFLSMRR